jgi:hypothetical protein
MHEFAEVLRKTMHATPARRCLQAAQVTPASRPKSAYPHNEVFVECLHNLQNSPSLSDSTKSLVMTVLGTSKSAGPETPKPAVPATPKALDFSCEFSTPPANPVRSIKGAGTMSHSELMAHCTAFNAQLLNSLKKSQLKHSLAPTPLPKSDAEAVPQPRASAPATADPTTLSGSNNGRKRERDLNPYEALHHIKPGSPASLWQGAGQRVVLHLSQTGVPQAVKVVECRSSEARYALKNEISILQSLQHKNIVRLLKVDEWERFSYLTLEFTGAGSLRKVMHLTTTRCIALTALRTYAAEILAALAHLHSINIVHGDIRPDNAFLCPDGGIKIGGFGSAIVDDGSALWPRSPAAAYMAPELLTKARVARKTQVDVWGFGLTMLECASGFAVFPDQGIAGLVMDPRSKAEFAIQGCDKIVEHALLLVPLRAEEDTVFQMFAHLCYQCIQLNPDDRSTAECLQEHSFVSAAALVF